MSRLRPYAAEVQHGVPYGVPNGTSNEPLIPVTVVMMVLVAAGVGVGTYLVPETATPVGLALATFVTLHRIRRQFR